MSVSLNQAGVDGFMQGLQSAVATGSGAATLEVYSNGPTLLATFTLPNPEFTYLSSPQILRLNGAPLASSNAASSAAPLTFRLKNRAGTQIISGSVGLTGDIYATQFSATSGSPVTLSEFELVFTGTDLLGRGSVAVP